MRLERAGRLGPRGLRGAQIIPFPLVRRRDFVLRQAVRMAEMRERGAENHLRYQLQRQADVMAQRGVRPDAIEDQVNALERAIRGELARLRPTHGSAA